MVVTEQFGSGTTPVFGDTRRTLLVKDAILLGKVPLKGDTIRIELGRIANVNARAGDTLRTLLKKEALL